MEWNINENDTLYAIHLHLPDDIEATIGAFGTFPFPNGHYVYIGSAKKNIRSRVERHYKMDKPNRWHLDYFRPYCTITKIETFDGAIGECALAATFLQNGTIPVKNFGSSDCKCGGHLILLNESRNDS